MSVLERCPSYRESNKRNKERQGPTLGVRFTEVSVKRQFTVIVIFSGQKPYTRILSIILHSFLHFSRAINVISYMKYSETAKKRFLWEP